MSLKGAKDMHGTTAIADALKRSGYDANSVLRRQAAYELLRLCGNDVDLAIAECLHAKADMEAESLRGGGRDHGSALHADAASPLPKGEGEGQTKCDAHNRRAPSSSPQSDAAGLKKIDNHASRASPSPSNGAPEGQSIRATHEQDSPARQPIHKPRSVADIKASIEIERISAKTILATMLTSDGMPWGEVGFHELDGMQRDGSIAQAIKQLYGSRYAQGDNRLRFKRLKELLTPDEFKQAVDLARETVNG